LKLLNSSGVRVWWSESGADIIKGGTGPYAIVLIVVPNILPLKKDLLLNK